MWRVNFMYDVDEGITVILWVKMQFKDMWIVQ